MKPYNYKNKKNSPYFLINSKISEINSISSLFTNYSNEKNSKYKDINLHKSFGPITPSLTLKATHKNNNSEISKLSFGKNNISKMNNKKNSLYYLFKNKKPNILKNKFSMKKNTQLRKFIFEKEKEKQKNITLSNDKSIKSNNSKNLLNNRRNISVNNISVSNISNKNDIKNDNSKDKTNTSHNINNINDKKLENKKKIKLIKKPYKIACINNNNKYEGLSNKDFYIHFNSLLDNILRKKEKELDNKIKTTSNKSLFEKIYNNMYQFNRKVKKIKKFYPLLHECLWEETTSTEKKKNLPHFYGNYLNKNKKVFGNLNVTYTELKNDIIYDTIYDKTSKVQKRAFTKDLNYEELGHDVKEMKRDIGYEKPSIELFMDKSTAFNFLSGVFDRLNKLNSTIAYKHRHYFAKKYDIDLKKDLFKIETDNDNYLFKFRKKLPQ